QINFTLQTPRPGFSFSGIEVERIPVEKTTAKFDLLVTAYERPNQLGLTIEYNTDLFDAARIDRMMGHYQTLLEGIVADAGKTISRLPILTSAEREQLLVDWNQTTTSYGEHKCVHELFSAQAELAPDSVAVSFEEHNLTYAELDQKANQLARFLRSRGVGAESLVGICVKRSPEMVIGLLGVLKAGGAYLPLDPNHPEELLSYMLRDAHASILLTEESLRTRLSESTAEVICLDGDWKAIGEQDASPIPNIAQPDNLAYIIYTSGSTGTPRGVMVTHSGLENYLQWSTRAYRVREGSGSLVHSPLGFDLTVTSLWAPLVSGQRVTLLREDEANARGIEDLAQALSAGADHSLLKLTPSHLEGLSHLLPKNDLGKTRALIVGGEALFGEWLSLWRTAARDTRIINEYGPTETVVGCCVYEVAGEHSEGPVPIGRPIANTTLYVLDDRLEPVPVGVPGELYIGGVGVARGYLIRPGLTAEKFIPDPFSTNPGARLYRSGDLVRYLEDGNLEYIGRRDNQVKLRGYRIELGEIEAVVNSHPLVHEAVVLAREDEPGDKRLVGYVAADMNELDDELSKHLEAGHVSEWQEVFDEAYAQARQPADPKFNIVGWNSRYTGKRIPENEMLEWVERTVERIRSLRPKRVLEIGCGSGLLLFRLAPECEHYHGIDISQAALDYLGKHLHTSDPGLTNVTLSQQHGADLSEFQSGSFDTVVVNSVAQYFPSSGYLLAVLKEAVRIVKPEGSIFLGDLRSLVL
ncbi:MAG TPA: amino acid adenylation domain-containing protein, partial [Pyrinomonadaceae bacterium]